MAEKIIIYGKDTWPHTTAAREAYSKKGKPVDYINVKSGADQLDTMLKYSDGVRKVPVIIDGETVTIGYKGGTWAIWFPSAGSRKNSDIFNLTTSVIVALIQLY